MAFSSDMTASYAIPVRRAGVLPAASFRPHLTVTAFAARLTIPAVGPIEDFHPQVSVSGRAHPNKKSVAAQTAATLERHHNTSESKLLRR